MRYVFKIYFYALAAISIVNGLWMLASAVQWFNLIPAAMCDTGKPNLHLIHDVGMVYAISGLGAIWVARNPAGTFQMQLAITAFFVGHALLHVGEIFNGLLPPSHWLIDFPLVLAPAIVLAILILPGVRARAL